MLQARQIFARGFEQSSIFERQASTSQATNRTTSEFLAMQLLDRQQARVLARILGVVAIAVSVRFFVTAPVRPTGRLSWLTGPIFDVAGSLGLALFWLAMGLFLILISFSKKGD
jgi:hypothetical protein